MGRPFAGDREAPAVSARGDVDKISSVSSSDIELNRFSCCRMICRVSSKSSSCDDAAAAELSGARGSAFVFVVTENAFIVDMATKPKSKDSRKIIGEFDLGKG